LLFLFGKLDATSHFYTWFKSWVLISFDQVERWLINKNSFGLDSWSVWLFGLHWRLLLFDFLIIIVQYLDVLYMLQFARWVRALAVLHVIDANKATEHYYYKN
jgi:hypothetical protein